jgi:hypothetical protein
LKEAPVAVNESRLKTGKLTLGGAAGVGGTEFACQATNVRVTPSHDETGDEVETLCGDKLAPDVKTSWSLAGTSIQDFDSPDGFVQYSVENNLQVVEYSWQPNTSTFEVTGTVQVRAVEIGGDVNTRLTTDFEWPCQDDPVFTWPTVAGTATAGSPAAEEPTAEEAEAETVDGPPSTPEAPTEPDEEEAPPSTEDEARAEHAISLAEGGHDEQANTTGGYGQ